MRYLCMAFVIYVIGAVRVHECGRTRIQIYAVCMIEIRSSSLFHGFPRFLIPFEFVSWRQCAPLERASSYRVNCIFIREMRAQTATCGWMASPMLPIGNELTSIAIRQSWTIADFFSFIFSEWFHLCETRKTRDCIAQVSLECGRPRIATLSFYTKLHLFCIGQIWFGRIQR